MSVIESLVPVIFLGFYIFVIKRYRISGQKTALFGFILLFLTFLFSLIGSDILSGISAQYVFLLFIISFIQEFSSYLNNENKK